MSLSKPEKSQNKNMLALVLGWSDCWAAHPPLTQPQSAAAAGKNPLLSDCM